MIFCYGTFVKVLNLCKTGKRNPTQKELHNRILSSIYEPYCNVGIADDASTKLLQCRQGLSDDVIKEARQIIDNGEVKKVAERFQKKILEAHLLKSDITTRHVLVSALLDLINKDTSISENTVVDLVGEVTKKDLLLQKRFILSNFLAGIFLYTVVAVDNRSGIEACQEINENYLMKFYVEDSQLYIMDQLISLGEEPISAPEIDKAKQDEMAESSSELDSIICECNYILCKAQDKVRVYSWDELDFRSIYVVPLLGKTPNSEEKPSTFSDSTQTRKDDLTEKEIENLMENSEIVEKENENNVQREGVKNETNIFLHNLDLFYNSIFENILQYLKYNEILIADEIPVQKPEPTIADRKEIISHIFEYDNIIYVVGGAGYGKSLFLKSLCVNPDILVDFTKKPRLIIRGDIKRLIRSDGTFRPMEEYLEECFTNGSLKRSSSVFPDFLSKCLMEGRCLVLLDALDEVGNDQRNELHNLIVSYFEDTYPENKVCITSRERGFIPRKNITCFYIRPITFYDVQEYVECFIKLNKFATEEKERFFEQAKNLVEKGFIKGFLTLSLLLVIYKNEEELPTNKLLLYEKCFEYIATTREKSKRLLKNSSTGEEYDWKVLGKFMTDATFMELARLGTPNNKDIPERAINGLMLDLYKSRFDSEAECRMATEVFLDFCSDRTEIFVPSSNSNIDYRFFHRSFYEYFYAKYIEMRTRDVDETYQKLLDFDIDSEIFELTITLYERRNPYYLKELVLRVFQYAEEELQSQITTYRGIDILVMVMQVVDDKEFIHRFVELFLTEGDTISKLAISVDFGMINAVFMRDAEFTKQQISCNNDALLTKIKKALIKFLTTQKACCNEIQKKMKQKGQNSTTLDDVKSQKGFSYPRLLIWFSDPYVKMEKFFEKFSDRNYLIGRERIDYRETNRILVFIAKVNALSIKDRIQVYNEILMKA